MAQGKCTNPNCTVAETGICLESHAILQDCPNYNNPEEQAEKSVDASARSIKQVVSDLPISLIPVRQFHTGNELGTLDTVAVTRRRYSYLIGILGSTNVGKTCFLSALYLLASQGELMPDYYFAGSLTLQGFEERVRRLRTWSDGKLPDQLVAHTQLQDPRSPAFMHLCIKQNIVNGKFLELLLTDLPGEWTDNLIKSTRGIAPFGFLQRANGILYVIDGPVATNKETKNLEVYNAKVAFDRLIENLKLDKRIPITLIVSKCDEINMQCPNGILEIKRHVEGYGFSVSVVLTAAISRKPTQFRSGTGVIDAIKSALAPCDPFEKKDSFEEKEYPQRSFWKFPLH
jgi:hypothetical protein